MKIEDIKKKYELGWMKIRGVEGVGITEEEGRPVIVLYISEESEELQKIPDHIEGCPVVKKISGEFNAL